MEREVDQVEVSAPKLQERLIRTLAVLKEQAGDLLDKLEGFGWLDLDRVMPPSIVVQCILVHQYLCSVEGEGPKGTKPPKDRTSLTSASDKLRIRFDNG